MTFYARIVIELVTYSCLSLIKPDCLRISCLGVAILVSDKVDFKPTLIKRDKEGHSILIKGEID
jgi:hypothetical protein